MKKPIVIFFITITLAFSSLGIFAQTEQQLTAEAEKVAQDYISRNVNAVRDKILASDSAEKAEEQALVILRVDPLNPTILFALGQTYAAAERAQLTGFKKEGEDLIAKCKNFLSQFQSVLQSSSDGKIFQNEANNSINSISKMLIPINQLLGF